MSALPPKADITERDRHVRCAISGPHAPQNNVRTLASTAASSTPAAMSAVVPLSEFVNMTMPYPASLRFFY
jgi:hypothetical protein